MCQGRHKHYHKFDLITKHIVGGILNSIDRNPFFAIEIKTLLHFRNITEVKKVNSASVQQCIMGVKVILGGTRARGIGLRSSLVKIC